MVADSNRVCGNAICSLATGLQSLCGSYMDRSSSDPWIYYRNLPCFGAALNIYYTVASDTGFDRFASFCQDVWVDVCVCVCTRERECVCQGLMWFRIPVPPCCQLLKWPCSESTVRNDFSFATRWLGVFKGPCHLQCAHNDSRLLWTPVNDPPLSETPQASSLVPWAWPSPEDWPIRVCYWAGDEEVSATDQTGDLL